MYKELIKESKKYFGVIYKLTNSLNKKIYIGQTTNLKSRIKDYKYKKLNRKSNLYHLIEEINKIGFKHFNIEIIDYCRNKIEMNEKEIFWIKTLDTLNPELGYNKKTGGLGGALNIETRQKMSESSKLFRHTEETKIKKSKRIIVYKDNKFTIFQSAKIFSDLINTQRTCVTRAIKKGQTIKGYYVFYENSIERLNNIKNIRRGDSDLYFKILNTIDCSVETIESYYFIII